MRTIRLRASPSPYVVRAIFPPDPELITLIKAVPGRKWNPTMRVWDIPSTPETIENLKRAALHCDVQILADETVRDNHARQLAALSHANSARERGDSDIVFDYVTQPYGHQRAGLEFLAHLGGGALLWEMGTGKTKTAIDFCEWLAKQGGDGPFRVLVICPNTVKRSWASEIEKHAGHTWYTVDKPVGTEPYTIVNCEKLSLKSTLAPIAEREWDVVIVDESTRFKNPTANRTKALHKLKAHHRLILTGTPITGKPEDAWAQFQFVAPGLLGSWWSFRDRYLALDYFKHPVGIKPGMAGELKSLIASRSYRVLKQDVLDLPPKVYADRIVEMTGVQKTAYHQMKEDLRVQIEGMEGASAFNILTVLLRLTQITAGLVGESDRYTWLDKDNAKLAELDNLLNDELAGEQVVIFGNYQRELEKLAYHFCRSEFDIGEPPIIYGPTPEKRRHQIIDDFQAGRRRLLFAQQRTGGIGITLTAAKTAIYYTRSWSLEEYLQSQDRLHRIGQTGTVSILHLIAKGSIDEEIAKALRGKQTLADQLTGDDARRIARDLLK
jgi:SNF2 family DNA or RNA helicase